MNNDLFMKSIIDSASSAAKAVIQSTTFTQIKEATVIDISQTRDRTYTVSCSGGEKYTITTDNSLGLTLQNKIHVLLQKNTTNRTLVLEDIVYSMVSKMIDEGGGSYTPTNLATVATTGSYNDLIDKPTIPHVAEYTISEINVVSGYAKSYQLFKDSVAIGSVINIPKDMVVSDGAVVTVQTNGVPYSSAVVGDKYIDLTIANTDNTHIYIPVTDLVDVYTGGDGISISESNVIKVNFCNDSTQVQANGNASVGTSSLISRVDHVHPLQESVSGSSGSCTGNSATASKLATKVKIAGSNFDGSENIDISYNNLTDKPTIPSGVEVVDSLTSTSTTSSLSANQGRVLSESIDALNSRIEILENSIKEMHYLN